MCSVVYRFWTLVTGFSCESYVERPFSGVVAVNNVWNKDYALGTQCLGIDALKKLGFSAGWAWSWTNRVDTELPKSSAYIAYGFVPWRKETTAAKLPVRVSNLKSAVVHYDFSTHGSGKNETSLRLYLTATDKPTSGNIHSEIVIWLASSQSKPWADYQGEIAVGGKKYGLWTGKIENRKYITLKAENAATSGTLDMRPFLTALAQHKDIDKNLYLASIQLGDEITSGRGYTIVNAFDVEIR